MKGSVSHRPTSFAKYFPSTHSREAVLNGKQSSHWNVLTVAIWILCVCACYNRALIHSAYHSQLFHRRSVNVSVRVDFKWNEISLRRKSRINEYSICPFWQICSCKRVKWPPRSTDQFPFKSDFLFSINFHALWFVKSLQRFLRRMLFIYINALRTLADRMMIVRRVQIARIDPIVWANRRTCNR